MDIIIEHAPKHNTQLRPNLWLTSQGAVVGYGPMLAGNGYAFCFTCGTDECQHVQQLDEAWLKGEDSQEIPFDGRPMGGDESSEAARLGLPVGW